MLITNLRRAQLLPILPSGGTAAEVGVFNGGFSLNIVRYNKPVKLHLIDPWGIEDDKGKSFDYGGKINDLYENVKKIHTDAVASGQVEIHRAYSATAMPKFPDGHFDWIYVDALHDYESVKHDLGVVAPKVKQDGFIFGHDFSNSAKSRRSRFGVVKAVREFIAGGEWKMIALTNEPSASYVLARSESSESTKAFLAGIVGQDPLAIDFGIEMLDHFEQVVVQAANGNEVTIYRFGKNAPSSM